MTPREGIAEGDAEDDEAAYLLPATIDPVSLRKFFTLQEADREAINRCRGPATRLGFAVQLCALRWRGHFLRDPTKVPTDIAELLADQLGVAAATLDAYPNNRDTRGEHWERLRQHLGFVRCGPARREALLAHMTTVALTVPRATTLYPLACGWLLDHKIVRPSPRTLRDLLAQARERALNQTYEALTAELGPAQREHLDALLAVPAVDPRSAFAPTRTRLETYKGVPPRESAKAVHDLARQIAELQSYGLLSLAALAGLHPATRRLLAGWGYAYDVWSLKRFEPAKRYGIVLCFLQAALAEATDALVEMQDKLITQFHHKARQRRADLLNATERARSRAVEVLEQLGGLVLDAGIPDAALRARIFARHSREEMGLLVEGCRVLREGDPGSPLGLIGHWYGKARQYSPVLLEAAPLCFAAGSALGQAVAYLREINRGHRRKLGPEAPVAFLPRRWAKHVVTSEQGVPVISRPLYEMAVLSLLNEGIKSGDVTLTGSRRWTDFEDYLIPRERWAAERLDHYASLDLPTDPEVWLARQDTELKRVTAAVEARLPGNRRLSIDAQRGEFKLARPKEASEVGAPAPAESAIERLVKRRMPRVDLADLLIDLDNETDFLRHFLPPGHGTRLDAALQRRNVLAALMAIGCNIGPERMAAASPGITVHDIAQVADWRFTEEALKAAVIDLVNYASRLPLSQRWGGGDTCSADGMRFHVPVNLLSADYSPLLQDRGVTLLAHTLDNYLQLHQKPIPCRLREAVFNLDGLMEHDTELDPKVLYTDTHGYTEVVMATAALLGFSLEPRIADIKDQTLYKIDRHATYPGLDPILTGTIRTHLIRPAWDDVVRLIASIRTRTVSPSLLLHRLGSYARQNRLHQALAEIGRIRKTIFILRFLDDEGYRRHISRELNKGEQSHALSRFLCFGKEGAIRGREFQDQLHTFSCLAVLHNAVVAWNTLKMTDIVEQLQREGHTVTERDLAHLSPLLRRHINPFGQYRFDLTRMRAAA